MVTLNSNLLDLKRKKVGDSIENQTPLKRYFTLKEASVYIGRGVFGIRSLIWKGLLPVIRNARKQYLDKEDLDRYMTSLKETYSLRRQDERPDNGKPGRRTS